MSDVVDQITASIGAHGMWKQRIVNAIDTGTCEWTPETVQTDCNCEFGKWLHSCDGATQSSPHYQEVRRLHAEFHKVAADVLSLALAGQKDKASSAIEHNGTYANISGDLVREMMNWRNSLN